MSTDKKNVFCLIIDALSYAAMTSEYAPMPFLTKLCKKGCNCENIYSQGPYTEAALTPFYTGRDNLDFGGNFFRGDEAALTVFEAVEKRGYDVINYTQPLIYPKPMHRGINEERYGVAYFFSAVWDYRLAYFRDVEHDGGLTQADRQKVYELLDANFAFWIKYLKDCRDEKTAADFINAYADRSYDFDGNIAAVKEQYDAFLRDKAAYVAELFRQGEDHAVFKIPQYGMTKKADNAHVYFAVYAEFEAFFKKLERFNKKHNAHCDCGFWGTAKSLIKALLRFSKKDAYTAAKRYSYYRRLCRTGDELRAMKAHMSDYKPEPTALEYFKHFEAWRNKRSADKPFYCMMHVSDLHTPEIFFSIDSTDVELVREELRAAESYLDSLPDDFTGNAVYYLSMYYVDGCIKKIYERLAADGTLDRTLFIVTADHGSSFAFDPVRDSVVNNEHEENYHIPCVLVGDGASPRADGRYRTTKDIVKTVACYCGADSDGFTGADILTGGASESYGVAITEYLGGGCPDISRRDLVLIARNDDYVVGFSAPISAEFSEAGIFCVYDRARDPKERKNLVGKTELERVGALIAALEKRFNEVKKENIHEDQA
ncbi:MAG: sulfatase-like hydrolase/transferase [Roseburia sp.]|nr:sulfatase-like hydrolase/transferase [Roseburia sp.]